MMRSDSASNDQDLYRALTIKQVAERLSVSRPTVEKWIKAGELESLELGGCRRILLADLEVFISLRRKTGWRPLDKHDTQKFHDLY